jgi:hypothetical protein
LSEEAEEAELLATAHLVKTLFLAHLEEEVEDQVR